MKLKALTPLLLIALSSCNYKSQNSDEEIGSKYSTQLQSHISLLPLDVKADRDTTYISHQNNRIYKRLYDEKVVNDSFVPIVEQLGYLLLTRTEHRYMVDDYRMNYIETIPGGSAFLFDAGKLAFRGGYIQEFEALVNRYIAKYGYYGIVKNTVETKGISRPVSFKYNLFYSALYIDDKNINALDAMAEASQKGWFKWETKTPSNEMGSYMHSQFVFEEKFFEFLKVNNPHSHYAPKYDYSLSAYDLNALYQENEIVADNVYKGKRLLIKGVITNIAKNAFDQPYITLNTERLFQEIHCEIPADEGMRLKKYSEVTVLGICNGMLMRSVFLKECHIIDNK